MIILLLLLNRVNEAISILDSNKEILVVVSDLKTPRMNGIELISKIKRPFAQKICIMLTAFAKTDVMLKAINKNLIFRYLL